MWMRRSSIAATTAAVIPFTDDDGLRDWRPPVATPPRVRRPRWPWLVVLAFALGILLGGVR
jgi:hypothetical protein